MLDIVCLLLWGKLSSPFLFKMLYINFFYFFYNYSRWKQGEALGSKNEGIVAPIEAIIRKKGRGLGS